MFNTYVVEWLGIQMLMLSSYKSNSLKVYLLLLLSDCSCTWHVKSTDMQFLNLHVMAFTEYWLTLLLLNIFFCLFCFCCSRDDG